MSILSGLRYSSSLKSALISVELTRGVSHTLLVLIAGTMREATVAITGSTEVLLATLRRLELVS